MKIAHSTRDAKGWLLGKWNADLPLAIGYANVGIDEPHVHSRITEIYLVAQGEAEIRIEQQTVRLATGDVIVVEPNEAHTFITSSADYFHFVIHAPSLTGDELKAEKTAVTRERLGLI